MEDAPNPWRVLIDIGTDGGRTGVREPAQAVELAAAVKAAPGLRLAGVAGYEGDVTRVGRGRPLCQPHPVAHDDSPA
ncbi:hypothetical protein ACFYM5_21110 [Streptomyces sp. NPDC006706]|uniref:hypothetical protein n=1 Tax=Streptomyces sp. NPDC006706 TaxID=3364761 RepID=UPI0036A10163